MQLTFAHTQVIGAGYQPCAIHSEDNYAQVIFVGDGGYIYAVDAPTPLGNFNSLVFSDPYKICDDIAVEYLKLRHDANSIMVVWKNDAEEGETVPYQPGVTHDLRHRFAVWAVRQNISKYLVNGSVSFSLDDSVATLSLTLENPGYLLSHEYSSLVPPGTQIALFFKSGDSERFGLGRYYIDRNDMSVSDGTTNVDGRNTIGKLLKDQTFDEDNNYPLQNLQLLAQDILDKAEVNFYWVMTTAITRGMRFPPDMNLLSGFDELIQTVMSWQLREDLDGKIFFGDKTDSHFPQAATYEFVRDHDIFSRSVTRDDQDAYARVCVHNDDYSIAVYHDIEFKFPMGAKKTMHVSIAKESTLADAQIYAEELAYLMGSVGTIEDFSGPFRPHLQPGDNAKITGKVTKMLGMVTSVTHNFGRDGYTTDFTVDSGLQAGRTKVSDYINKISGQSQGGGQAVRLYS